jgi:Rieske Fe-S protein
MANPGTSRRRFLNFLTSLVMAAIGLLVAIPALVYLWAPLRRKAGSAEVFVDAGPVADIPIGQWRLLSIQPTDEGIRKEKEKARKDTKATSARHAVWVRRQGEGEQDITVLSTICPHLGCPVNWHPDQSRFVCPCHGGLFDVEGRQTGGPPPRSLDRLEFETRQGRLWVRWQEFKSGVAERIPVNG